MRRTLVELGTHDVMTACMKVKSLTITALTWMSWLSTVATSTFADLESEGIFLASEF